MSIKSKYVLYKRRKVEQPLQSYIRELGLLEVDVKELNQVGGDSSLHVPQHAWQDLSQGFSKILNSFSVKELGGIVIGGAFIIAGLVKGYSIYKERGVSKIESVDPANYHQQVIKKETKNIEPKIVYQESKQIAEAAPENFVPKENSSEHCSSQEVWPKRLENIFVEDDNSFSVAFVEETSVYKTCFSKSHESLRDSLEDDSLGTGLYTTTSLDGGPSTFVLKDRINHSF